MLSLDVKSVGIDFLTTGTYKWLLDSYGVAPFYVREELLDLVRLDRFGSLHIAEDLGNHRYELHTDARKYDYATLVFGPVFQLSAALDCLHRVCAVQQLGGYRAVVGGDWGGWLRGTTRAKSGLARTRAL